MGRRASVAALLALGAVITACASLMGVDDPILATSVLSEDGGVFVGADGAASASDDGGCVGEGCPCGGDGDCLDPAHKSCVDGKCVECTLTPDNCRDSYYCLAPAAPGAANACAPGCKTNRECAAISSSATLCNTARHQCVECTGDEQCAAGGKKCSPSGVCTETCGDGGSCPGGKECCGGFCIDTKSDLFNCGACTNECKGQGALCCNSACKETLTDDTNCGACGLACSTVKGDPECKAGSCKWDCDEGFDHCAVGNTGCETPTSADVLKCGDCTTNCNDKVLHATNIACDDSKCAYTGACIPPYSDCDGKKSNGCECTCPPGCKDCKNGACNITCDGQNGQDCTNGVTCPPGLPCRITCKGQHACQGALVCPSGFPCTVICKDDQQVCNGLNINADNSALCLECDGASQACNGVTCTEPNNVDCKKHCGSGGACNSACGNCGSLSSPCP